MNVPTAGENRRILVIDDNETIHADFRKIFAGGSAAAELNDLEAELFGGPAVAARAKHADFHIDSAFQGQQGFAMVQEARKNGTPYSVAFVDVRMPPGWDGIETAQRMWSADPQLQVVICTAYSDFSWEQTIEKLGAGDRFLILKKPFDIAEVRQLALSLSVKWSLARQAQSRMAELETAVSERTRELSEVNAQLRKEMTERERMELELVRAQKLEALGHLVAGIAHEINNPLGFILSNLGYLENELARPQNELTSSLAEMSEVLRETSGGAQRIRRIVKDLKTFCRNDEGGPEPVDVHHVLDSTLNITATDLNKVARLERQYGAVPQVMANGSRLGQVFLNLVINAAQALSSTRSPDNSLVVRTSVDGEHVLVEFIDNGCGISTANLGKIFNPFFTTKPQGHGTGLGLSICHGIVEAFGGSVEAASEEGKGATFKVRLRVAQPAALAQAVRGPTPRTRGLEPAESSSALAYSP